eukprot:gene18922-biopygen9989
MLRRRRCHKLALLKYPGQSMFPAARSRGRVHGEGVYYCQFDPAQATHEDLPNRSPLPCLGLVQSASHRPPTRNLPMAQLYHVQTVAGIQAAFKKRCVWGTLAHPHRSPHSCLPPHTPVRGARCKHFFRGGDTATHRLQVICWSTHRRFLFLRVAV